MKRRVKEIKTILTDKKRRPLLESFASLSTLNVVNYVFPLLTVPYLVRILGPANYGLVSFAQSFIQYFVILTNYGFNLSATNRIAVNREDLDKISIIFSSVMVIKTILSILGFLILCLVVLLFSKFSQDYLLYFLAFGAVLSEVLFPVWFFQGMEKMRYITFLRVFSKAIFTILIFVFVRQESHFIYVPLINSLGGIVSGFLALNVVFKTFKIKFSIPDRNHLIEELKDGWHFFLSTVSINLYTASNTFILGLLTNNTIVGYYAGAEKIMKVLQRLIQPITQALFPHMSKMVSNSQERALQFIRKLTPLVGGVSFTLSATTFILASLIVTIILGDEFGPSVRVLQFLAFVPFVVSLNNIFGVQLMIPFGYKKEFARVVLSAGIVNLILLLILIPQFGEVGVGISVLSTEIYVTVVQYLFLRSKNIRLFGGG